ncbi:MAG: FtsX-like permease family protein [Planctomycetota bacterium]
MRFIDLILKNLLRRPMRSTLTLVALATAIASVVALLGIAQGFTRSFADIYAAHSIDIVVSRQGSADRLSSSIDEQFVGQMEQLPGVERAAAVLLETLSLEEEGIYGIPTMGIARDSWLLEDYEFQVARSSGNDIKPEGEKSKRLGLMLGIHLAERLEVEVGGEISIFDESYRVANIFQSPSTWENGSMILPIALLQDLTDRQGQATYINVILDAEVSALGAAKAIQAIEGLDSKLLPLATQEFVETDTRMQLAGAMAWMTGVIALVIGTIGTLNTMLTSVMERTKEIGILRAIGWTKKRIIRMILLESCAMSLVAGVVGTLLAMLLTWALSQAPAAKGILSPSIGTSVILQGFLLALGIGLLGAILPAWRAARMMPTEAFRE